MGIWDLRLGFWVRCEFSLVVSGGEVDEDGRLMGEESRWWGYLQSLPERKSFILQQ